MRMVINADDLGLSEEVNEAVFKLMDAGRITSSTLLANGPAVEAAAREARRRPRQSFGVHLNLTELSPLEPLPRLKPLLNCAGEFAGNLRNVPITAALKESILVEWRAQVRRIMDLGINPSHFDSHHHVHTIPALMPVLKRLQREFGIRRVRLSKNFYGPGRRPGVTLLAAKAFWNFVLRNWYHTRTTAAFTSLADFVENGAASRHSSIELMVHPGASGFAAETDALAGDWRERLACPSELISYHAV